MLENNDNNGKNGKHTPGVFIKNLGAEPDSAFNDGSSSVRLRCTVFSRNDHASISSVRVDMRHTSLFRDVPLSPVEGGILEESGEGAYQGLIEIPEFMDPGQYRLPITAEDSTGGAGHRTGFLYVDYRRKSDLPRIGTPEFAGFLEQVGAAQFTHGNRLEVLADGSEALDKRLGLIRDAGRQINIESYTFGRHGAGGAIMDALVGKTEEGVELNIILNGDTQIPTSPLNALRLKLNQLWSQWKWPGARPEEGDESTETSVRPLRRKERKGGRVSLLMFNGKDMREKLTGPADGTKIPDHWLDRLLREEQDVDTQLVPQEWLASFTGPGGLPALPLMDYAVHEKIFVVDGEHALVGGRNLEDHYFNQWDDLDLYIRGPLVESVQRGFLRNFKEVSEAQGQPVQPSEILHVPEKQDGASAIFIQNRPWTREYNALNALVASIQASTTRFWAFSQYVVLPPCLLRDAIMEAAGRGVDVRIVTNSLRTSRALHFGTGYFVSLNCMSDLVDAGVRMYFMDGLDDEEPLQPYSHRKEYLFDDHLAALGSFNISVRSSYIESENLVFVHDRDFCERREAVFEDIMDNGATLAEADFLNAQKTEFSTRVEIARYLELLY